MLPPSIYDDGYPGGPEIEYEEADFLEWCAENDWRPDDVLARDHYSEHLDELAREDVEWAAAEARAEARAERD